MRRILALLVIISNINQAQSLDPASKTGYNSINSSSLKTHLTILTSDSLEGRETTFPGQKKAAQYIADIFRNLHLEPLDNQRTYFQHFDVEVTRVNPETKIVTSIQGKKKTYSWGADFISESTRDTIVSGPAAFVGFTDTELDSASQAKLQGRIVFVFLGKKGLVNDTSRAVALRRMYALRRDAGALATLMIPDAEGPAIFTQVRNTMRKYSSEKGSMRMKEDAPPSRSQFTRFIVTRDMAEDVLHPSGKNLTLLQNEVLNSEIFAPVFLDSSIITIQAKIIQETKQTENVIGLLPGSDPTLKSEAVIITAHYDHLGKDKDGTIYFGADDDGSGTATVLELAKAFSINPVKPKRSLIFMTVVGEEKGLFGSTYYVRHPLFPLSNTMANLNADMIGRLDPVQEAAQDSNSIYVIGSDKISAELDSLLRLANTSTERLRLDYKYNDENDPEQYYRRSDHYNFAKNGIPIVFFFDGTHKDYHKPTDTIEKILFNRMSRVVRVIYDLGWKLGNLDHTLVKNTSR